MSIELITILLFASLMFLLATGLQIVFAMASVAVIFSFFLIGPGSLGFVTSAVYRLMSSFMLIAIPLFIFMGSILESSGVVDDLYTMMHKWFGSLRGGLAIGTVLICTVFGAMSGVSAAATVTLGVIALPALHKRGYDKKMTMGCIAAGGALSVLIPPSVGMIIWALWADESVGQMFVGGIIPGLLLSALFIIYIGIRCYLQPNLGPAIAPEERVGWRDKFISLKAVLLPLLIIIGVLGSIFSGIATPTEAAGVGVLFSIISAVLHRKLNWKALNKALFSSFRLTCMIIWIMIAGAAFSAVFVGIGAQEFILSTVKTLGVNRWVILLGIQIIYIILGMLIDPSSITMLTVPIFVPIIKSLGFNSLWFGVLFMINTEMGFITPPFGMNLFYMRAVAPKNTTMEDIYRSALPFIMLQLMVLILCIIFPQLILYLPTLLFYK